MDTDSNSSDGTSNWDIPGMYLDEKEDPYANFPSYIDSIRGDHQLDGRYLGMIDYYHNNNIRCLWAFMLVLVFGNGNRRGVVDENGKSVYMNFDREGNPYPVDTHPLGSGETINEAYAARTRAREAEEAAEAQQSSTAPLSESASCLSDHTNFGKIGTQDPITPIAYGIIKLHDHILFFLAVILFIVGYLLYSTYKKFYAGDLNREWLESKISPQFAKLIDSYKQHLSFSVSNRTYNINHGTIIEVIGTVLPAVVLLFIAIPSFALLYAMDEIIDPVLTIKVIGHQGYGSYEYSDYSYVHVAKASFDTLDVLAYYDYLHYDSGFAEQFLGKKPDRRYSEIMNFPMIIPDTTIKFDSYMVHESDLNVGDLRLLKTDMPLFLPKNTHIRLLITSSDVLHSGAVPSFGVKVDAVPGRLNQTSLYLKNTGTFYGQCSELCGVNHAFMPIEVYVVNPVHFYNYIYIYFRNFPFGFNSYVVDYY